MFCLGPLASKVSDNWSGSYSYPRSRFDFFVPSNQRKTKVRSISAGCFPCARSWFHPKKCQKQGKTHGPTMASLSKATCRASTRAIFCFSAATAASGSHRVAANGGMCASAVLDGTRPASCFPTPTRGARTCLWFPLPASRRTRKSFTRAWRAFS